MAGPVVKVDGLTQLRKTMKRAGVDLADLKDAHAAAARYVAARGAGLAPKRTGALAGTVRGSGAAGAATIRAGYASVPYALPIHWGWPGHHIAPNPFLSTAATSTESAWIIGYQAAVRRIVDHIEGI